MTGISSTSARRCGGVQGLRRGHTEQGSMPLQKKYESQRGVAVDPEARVVVDAGVGRHDVDRPHVEEVLVSGIGRDRGRLSPSSPDLREIDVLLRCRVAVAQEHHVDAILRWSGSLNLGHRALCERCRSDGPGVVDADGRAADLAARCEILDALGQCRVGAGGGDVGGNRACCEQRESASRNHCCRETSSDGQCDPPLGRG